MDNGDFFDAFLKNASNYQGGELEYFEDTHDANGNYIGSPRASTPPFGQSAQPANMYGMPPQQPPQHQGYYVLPVQQGGYTPPPSASPAAQRTEMILSNPTQFGQSAQRQQVSGQPMPLPTTEQYISPQLNQNFVIYRPRTTADVEQLISYLRRREPALVDLDPIADSPDAQRLMDFTSGAAYALGDRVMTIRRNLFLITPDTIDVLKPEKDK
ncbi:MAG: cell division protein SepF [Clostridiales bacterium]|nr:cell division protein SepF [Clostridiales bacterium]